MGSLRAHHIRACAYALWFFPVSCQCMTIAFFIVCSLPPKCDLPSEPMSVIASVLWKLLEELCHWKTRVWNIVILRHFHTRTPRRYYICKDLWKSPHSTGVLTFAYLNNECRTFLKRSNVTLSTTSSIQKWGFHYSWVRLSKDQLYFESFCFWSFFQKNLFNAGMTLQLELASWNIDTFFTFFCTKFIYNEY